ncbi:MAG: extracellular solute-binding protein, partial [Cellulosilyticaceae bacterium]
MVKRLIATLMILMIGGSVAGCSTNQSSTQEGKTETKTETKATGETKGEESGKAEKPETATVISEKVIEPKFFVCSSTDFTGNEIVFKAIEHYTNIKFKPIPVPLANYNEKLSTSLASGDIPDLMGCRSASTVDKYGPEGAFVQLTPYIEKGMMNDYMAVLDRYPNSKYLVKSPDGNIYGVPRIYDADYLMDESWIARTDILEKNGMTKTPETFDELYDMMKQLKELYPDSTPYTSRWGISHVIAGQTDMRNTNYTYFLNKVTNEYEYGPASQAYKDSIQFLAQAYKDGILDPDVATLSDEEFLEKFSSNKAFITYDYQIGDQLVRDAGSILEDGFEVSSILQPAYNGKREGAIILKGYYGYTKAISSSSKYVEELVKFLNWTCTEEGINALQFGVEGENYVMEDEKVKFLDDIKYSGNPGGKITNSGLNDGNIFSVFPQLGKETYEMTGEMARKSAEFLEGHDAFGETYNFAKFYSEKDKKRYTDIMTPINTFVEEASMKVITGAM